MMASKTGKPMGRQESPRTLLLLDLDGCIAPMGAVPEEENPLPIVGDWATWVISLDTQLWLESLPRGIEVCWASAWESYIEPVNAALGLDFDHLTFDMPTEAEWFKLSTVRGLVESGVYSTIVWVDDDLEEGAEALAAAHPELHLVRPDPTFGLNRDECATIDTLLRNGVSL